MIDFDIRPQFFDLIFLASTTFIQVFHHRNDNMSSGSMALMEWMFLTFTRNFVFLFSSIRKTFIPGQKQGERTLPINVSYICTSAYVDECSTNGMIDFDIHPQFFDFIFVTSTTFIRVFTTRRTLCLLYLIYVNISSYEEVSLGNLL